IALAVERIITVYKNLLEIRKLRNELRAKPGVTDDDVKGIESRAEKLMDEGIEELIPDLLDRFYKAADAGRKNEMKIEFKYSLSKSANRIDRGFNIEVRIEPTKSDEQQPADTKEKEYENIIEAAAPTLEFLKTEGKPILSLPEGGNGRQPESEPKEDSKKERKKT